MQQIALAILLYPGLALAIILGVAFRWLAEGRAPQPRLRVPPLSADGLASLASILLAALALVLLPWPLHPAAGQAWVGSPLALWIALEGAFLAPLLPGLLAPSALAARAAAREAQIGAAGRFVIWLSVGTALWTAAGWATWELPGRALAALAGLLALPAAIGTGLFGAERSLSAAGAEEGLDEATVDLLRFARIVRGAALLAVLIVASLPGPESALPLRPPVALALIGALFLAIGLALRRIAMALPRLTLPDALRWCWWRALPLAVAGLVYLVIRNA
ncbi:MAG: hypothetical protein ACJ8CR_11785 [Roseiflexaceae bacterium]